MIEADGGTRTASITGSFVALCDAVKWLSNRDLLDKNPVRDAVAAISTGIIGGVPMLDLCYDEDSTADVDMNLVMTGGGDLVEIQGTAEHHPFSTDQLAAMLELGKQGVNQLIDLQNQALDRDQARP